MNLPPSTFAIPVDGGPLRPLNGAATRARDVLEADRALTTLACARPLQPLATGSPLRGGQTYALQTLLPPYCAEVGFGLLATGRGSAAFSVAGDYNGVIQVDVAGAALDAANWVWMIDRRVVTADGTSRALITTDQAAPALVRFTLALTDTDATNPLRIWALQVRPLPRRSDLALF